MFYIGYDFQNKLVMINLCNTSDHEMTVRNSNEAIKFAFFNQQGVKLGTRNSSIRLHLEDTPSSIKIAPQSSKLLSYSLANILEGLPDDSEITTIEVNCRASYDIPNKNILNNASYRSYTLNISK